MAMVSTMARKTGPMIPAAARIPATTSTAAAALSRTISPRGTAHSISSAEVLDMLPS